MTRRTKSSRSLGLTEVLVDTRLMTDPSGTAAAMHGPNLGRPMVFSTMLGIAMASAAHALSMMRLARLEAEGAATAVDWGSFLATRPIVHVVVVPACVLAVYSLVQVAGLLAEQRVLRQAIVNTVTRLVMRIAGRRDTLNLATGQDGAASLAAVYGTLRSRTDRVLLRPIEFGTGALTMLGLLGTIVGLTLALQDLPAVMVSDATDADREQVLQSLGMAFATTIVGIIGSLLLSLVRVIIANIADKCDAIASGRE